LATAVAPRPLTILLASPRGFCAGVERAIAIVKEALRRNGPPVYVRHEIVHNRYVVDELRAMGAVFVEDLGEVPEDGIVVFSAHGVPKAIPAEARSRGLLFADATCPLVSKVHREVERHHRAGRTVLLIGHAGHPEIVGTIGQVPDGSVVLVETVEDAERALVPDPERVAFSTQTTLSLSDTAQIVEVLKRRFPNIVGPHKEDICYATTNRQEAVKRVAPVVDAMIVVGAPNSSNSQRLREVAQRAGCPRAVLMQRAADINWSDFDGVKRLGITAGASAPEVLVEEIMGAFAARFVLDIETVSAIEEGVFFPLPRPLREHEPAE
jgi:4-hydroxy-3-methylbut-2-enyl diphosphate reductase